MLLSGNNRTQFNVLHRTVPKIHTQGIGSPPPIELHCNKKPTGMLPLNVGTYFYDYVMTFSTFQQQVSDYGCVVF